MRRRTMIRGAVGSAFGIASAALLGCSDDDENTDSLSASSTTVGPSGVRRGGLLRISNTFAERNLDPHTSILTGSNPPWGLFGEQLLRIDHRTGNLDYRIAESSETMPDGLAIVLKIRPGVKTADKPPTNGTEFLAQDVVFNFDRIRGLLDPANVAKYQRRTLIESLDRAEAVDNHTVRLIMKQPDAGFIRGLGDWRQFMVPKAVIDKSGGIATGEDLIGTGPFVVERYEQDRAIDLRRHPGYWERDRPYLDGISVIAIVDTASQVSALLSGQIDALTGLNRSMEENITAAKADIQIVARPHPFWPNFRFNTVKPPFNDPRIREAVILMVDGPELMDAFYGPERWQYSGPSPSVFPNAISADDIAKRPGFRSPTKDDIKKAMDLLTAAAVSEGDGLAFKFTHRNQPGIVAIDLAVRFEANLRARAPKARISLEGIDASAHTSRINRGEFDMIEWQNLSNADPGLDLALFYSSNGGRNYGKYSNPTLDGLLTKVRITLNERERDDIFREAQELAIQAHYHKIYGNFYAVDAISKEVQGYSVGKFDAYGSGQLLYEARNLWFSK